MIPIIYVVVPVLGSILFSAAIIIDGMSYQSYTGKVKKTPKKKKNEIKFEWPKNVPQI